MENKDDKNISKPETTNDIERAVCVQQEYSNSDEE
jgi:hypothetical protein